MKNHHEIAEVLRVALSHCKLSQAQLRAEAGISQRTLTNVLSGQEDFKVSTLFALADRLGLEMVLVPKGSAPAISAGMVTQPVITARVQKALDRIGRKSGSGKGIATDNTWPSADDEEPGE